jgi:hypothetical protein
MSFASRERMKSSPGARSLAEASWQELVDVLATLPPASPESRNLAARATALVRWTRVGAAAVIETRERTGVPFPG